MTSLALEPNTLTHVQQGKSIIFNKQCNRIRNETCHEQCHTQSSREVAGARKSHVNFNVFLQRIVC